MSSDSFARVADTTMARLDHLATYSEDSGRLTRRYLTSAHRAALECVREWMAAAGLKTHVDAAGNLIGRLEVGDSDVPCLMLGSHIDTVVDAGRYDGALGILLPLTLLEALVAVGREFSHPIEIIAFGDEEGVRYQSTYLGSRAVTGHFDTSLLELVDVDGITLAQAREDFGITAPIESAARAPGSVGAFVEIHIEQGPVLENEDLSVAAVSAIAGATRLEVTWQGEAGHAGTVPMHMRRDALAGASEAVVWLEAYCKKMSGALVGTVGKLAVGPGAINVIPGQVQFSVDLRSGEDEVREAALAALYETFETIAARRSLEVSILPTHSANSVDCDPRLSGCLTQSMQAVGHGERVLASGAGHDTAAMAALAPSAMMFVRCDRGISHHPAESIETRDVVAAAGVLDAFLKRYAAWVQEVSS